jgi:formylmethanofuran dehydrogenase subunit A
LNEFIKIKTTTFIPLQKMVEFDLLIVNGIVVTDTEIAENAIAVKDGKIVRLISSSEQPYPSADKVIDAQGGYVTVRTALISHESLLNCNTQ